MQGLEGNQEALMHLEKAAKDYQLSEPAALCTQKLAAFAQVTSQLQLGGGGGGVQPPCRIVPSRSVNGTGSREFWPASMTKDDSSGHASIRKRISTSEFSMNADTSLQHQQQPLTLGFICACLFTLAMQGISASTGNACQS